MNNSKKIIAGRTIIAFSAILLVCCSYNKTHITQLDKEIRQIILCISFPTLAANNEFITIKDSQYITYYKDLVIYKFPYTTEHSRNVFDSTGEIIEHKLIRVDTNFHSLVYKKGHLHGFAFDSKSDTLRKRVLVDSFLNKRFFVIENRIYNSNDSLIYKNSKPNNEIQETYIRRIKIDDWDSDTNHLFFSNQFKDIDFSFSRRIDSVKGIKLFKIHAISNGDPKNNNFFFRRKREILLEIKESPVNDTGEILSLIDRFYKAS